MNDAVPNETGVGIDPIQLLKESVRPIVPGVNRGVVWFEDGRERCDRNTPKQRFYLAVKGLSIEQRRLTLPRLIEYGPADPACRVIENSGPLHAAQKA
jgi:hypothetical protein